MQVARHCARNCVAGYCVQGTQMNADVRDTGGVLFAALDSREGQINCI